MPASVPAYSPSAYHHRKQLVLVAVGHDGCITEAGDHGIDVASLAISHKEFLTPGGAVVCRDAALDIYLTIADIVATRAVVRDGEKMSVRCGSNGRDAIRLAVDIGGTVECMLI